MPLYGKFRALTFENAGITDLDKTVSSTIVTSDYSAHGEEPSGMAPRSRAEHEAGVVLSYRVEQLTHLRNWILEHTKGLLEELTQAYICIYVYIYIYI